MFYSSFIFAKQIFKHIKQIRYLYKTDHYTKASFYKFEKTEFKMSGMILYMVSKRSLKILKVNEIQYNESYIIVHYLKDQLALYLTVHHIVQVNKS